MATNNERGNDKKLPQSSTKITGTDLLEHLISNEENFIANILLKCLKLCPSSFGNLFFNKNSYTKLFLIYYCCLRQTTH